MDAVIVLLALLLCGEPAREFETRKEIGPGFRFQCWNYYLEVVEVTPKGYRFQSVTHPDATFVGDNMMTKKELHDLLLKCRQPKEAVDSNRRQGYKPGTP